MQEDSKEKVALLFGTQTGTAERFAKDLRKELQQRYGSDTRYDVIDIEEYDHETRLEKEKVVFLILATYGDGEPTDNAAELYSWTLKAAGEEQGDLLKASTASAPLRIYGRHKQLQS